MPLTDADFVQVNSGGFDAGSGSATLAATTAGNTVLIAVTCHGQTVATPSGFVRDTPAPADTNRLHLFRRSNVPAGETSWTLTPGASAPVAWIAMEVAVLDASFPLDISTGINLTTSGTSLPLNVSSFSSSTYDGVALVLHAASLNGTTPPTFSAQTNGYAEVADQGRSGASNSPGIAVSRKFTQTLGQFNGEFACTATVSASVTPGVAWGVVYSAAGAKQAANIVDMASFDWATVLGLSVGSAPLFHTVVGTPEIVTTAPRRGTHHLRLSATSAAESVARTLPNTAPVCVERINFRLSSLPSGDLELFALLGISNNLIVRYVSASQKLGVKIGTGAEVLSDATVAAGQYIGVDLRWDARANTHVADWQITYDATAGASSAPVVQTQASFSAGAADQTASWRMGWTAASTGDVYYDEPVVAISGGNYPLGDHEVRFLKVDPAGTLTVSGSAASFSTFTANGTMNSTFNVTTARDAIDEVPPTIGASADGFAQDAVAASDYVEIPMGTTAITGTASARAVRMLACGWAGSTASGTIEFRAWDGTTESGLISGALGFTNSTTAPTWAVVVVPRPTGGWTQAKLDALAFRVGFSTDATPDEGIHAIYAEVAIQPAQTQALFGTLATQALDPISGGVVGVTVDTTTTGQAADLYYEEGGSPTTVPVAANTTTTEAIDAPDAPTTNYIALYPDPEL